MRARALILLAAAMAPSIRAADPAAPAAAPNTDPEVRAMVEDINPERIQKSIFVLASFKTRNTLSDPLPSGDGIGGAVSRVRAEFEHFSQGGGGPPQRRARQCFAQHPVPPRIPHEVQITNVVATLPGTDTAPRAGRSSSAGTTTRGPRIPSTQRAPPWGADDDALGRRGRDRACARHVPLPLPRDDRLPRCRRRGARPERLDPLGEGGKGAPRRHRGDAGQRHHRQQPVRDRGGRPRLGPPLRPACVPPVAAPDDALLVPLQGRRRERHAARASSPARGPRTSRRRTSRPSRCA